MKETINVNIAQQAFTMDMDAYSALNAYLDDISRRLPESDTETMSDIEGRVAEIFREKVPSPMMVITYGVVRSTALPRISVPRIILSTPSSPAARLHAVSTARVPTVR